MLGFAIPVWDEVGAVLIKSSATITFGGSFVLLYIFTSRHVQLFNINFHLNWV